MADIMEQLSHEDGSKDASAVDAESLSDSGETAQSKPAKLTPEAKAEWWIEKAQLSIDDYEIQESPEDKAKGTVDKLTKLTAQLNKLSAKFNPVINKKAQCEFAALFVLNNEDFHNGLSLLNDECTAVIDLYKRIRCADLFVSASVPSAERKRSDVEDASPVWYRKYNYGTLNMAQLAIGK